jgi:hypothetical protein
MEYPLIVNFGKKRQEKRVKPKSKAIVFVVITLNLALNTANQNPKNYSQIIWIPLQIKFKNKLFGS